MALVTSHGAHLLSRSQGRADETAMVAPPLLPGIDAGVSPRTVPPIPRRSGSRQQCLDVAGHFARPSRPRMRRGRGSAPSRHRRRRPGADRAFRVRLRGDRHRARYRSTARCPRAFALPAASGRTGRPLAFHRWRPGDPAGPGAVRRPASRRPAAPRAPRMLVVPLLAFDRPGCRLGYGGGFYDRTLRPARRERPSGPSASPSSRKRSIACREPTDEPLDLVTPPPRVVLPGRSGPA